MSGNNFFKKLFLIYYTTSDYFMKLYLFSSLSTLHFALLYIIDCEYRLIKLGIVLLYYNK